MSDAIACAERFLPLVRSASRLPASRPDAERCPPGYSFPAQTSGLRAVQGKARSS